jgi:hypothetical protein
MSRPQPASNETAQAQPRSATGVAGDSSDASEGNARAVTVALGPEWVGTVKETIARLLRVDLDESTDAGTEIDTSRQ